MFKGLATKLRNLRLAYREDKALSLWESKKYQKLVNLFRNRQTYFTLKIDEYPFIFFLINEKDKTTIEVLLQKLPYKTDILNDEQNPMNMTPLPFAFLEGNQQIVEMIEKHGADINKLNSQGQNLLHLAAIYRRQQAFKNALARNLDYNLKDSYFNTPFHYAARAGSVIMTSLMIAARAKKIENKNHQFPIHMAIESGNQETFDLLRNDLAGVYPKYNPIHSASRSRSPRILTQVLNAKPSTLNMKDYKGLTALHHSVLVQQTDTVRTLLNKPGILVDEVDSYGNTPLHLAMINGNLDICSLLIENKANLDVENSESLSPADYGIMSDRKQMHVLLLRWKQRSQKIKQWAIIRN